MSETDQMEIGAEEEMDEDSESCSEEDEEGSSDEEDTGEKRVFLPGNEIEEGEELVVDESAYRILHQAQTGSPCLSFDVIKDDFGNSRESYPLSMYLLSGTQAPKVHVNKLNVIKMSNLHGTSTKDSDEESSDSENEDNTKTPSLSVASIKHQGCVNRVR